MLETLMLFLGPILTLLPVFTLCLCYVGSYWLMLAITGVYYVLSVHTVLSRFSAHINFILWPVSLVCFLLTFPLDALSILYLCFYIGSFLFLWIGGKRIMRKM